LRTTAENPPHSRTAEHTKKQSISHDEKPWEECMTELSRRSLLVGTAAAGAALAGPKATVTPANAAAPVAGKQNAGWYRYNVGTTEITVATDGKNVFKLPDTFVVNVPKDQVNEALAAARMEKDMMTIPYTPIAVNTGTKLVVIDTGTGEANFEKTKGAAGQFHTNLKASGIDRNNVDIVIISHFHGDHINGLLTADNKLAFPNAEILVPAAEWKYFMDDSEMGKQTTERMKGVFANARRVFDALNRKVTPYEPGKELAPGITSVATYGHTPGHNSHIVSSGSAVVYVQADVTNNPVLFARNPGWHAFFDQDGAMAEATRRKVYDMLATDRMMVQGFHYPFPSVAYIEKSGSGYREIPAPWNPTI
jgi:glyoxylase-like metal-dependent hydrolase (beta-lactamase superfamily II)